MDQTLVAFRKRNQKRENMLPVMSIDLCFAQDTVTYCIYCIHEKHIVYTVILFNSQGKHGIVKFNISQPPTELLKGCAASTTCEPM